LWAVWLEDKEIDDFPEKIISSLNTVIKMPHENPENPRSII